LQYFDNIPDAEMRAEALKTFPKMIQQEYIRWKSGKYKMS